MLGKGRRGLKATLETHGLESLFVTLQTADVAPSKPHPEIYLTAAARFAVDPAEMLVFEDSENGCKSGIAADANVIAVPSKRGELHSYEGCLFVAESLHDERIGSLI